MPRRTARPRSSLSHTAPARAKHAARTAHQPFLSNNNLAALLAATNDGVLLLRQNGTLMLSNAAAERMMAEGCVPLLDELPIKRVFAGGVVRDVLLARDLRAGGEQLLATSAVPLDGGVAVLLRDVTTTARLTAHIAVAEQQARVLTQAGARLDGSLDLRDVLGASVELATELLGFTVAWLGLPNESDSTLDIVAVHDAISGGARQAQAEVTRVSITHTLTGECFNQGRSLSLDRPKIVAFYRERANDEMLRQAHEHNTHAALLLPLLIQGRTIGVLGMFTNRSQHQEGAAGDLALAETLASRVAVAVEHARLHGEARALQHFYQSVTNSAGALLLTLDRQLRLTWANSEWDRSMRWLNLPDLLWNDVKGTSIVPLLPAARLPELLEMSRQLLRQGALASGETTYRTEIDAGLRRPPLTLLVRVRPRGSHAGAVEGLTVAVADISHLKQLEAALRERHDELQRTQVQLVAAARLAATGELIAGVAHELNNPLTSVLGWADLMLDAGAADLDGVRRIHDGALRARRIVQGLLMFARQAPAERAWTHMGSLADTVLALKATDFHRNAVRLRSNIAPQLPQVWVDGGQIQQVLLNLLTNAEQAMLPGGGEIFLTIAHDDNTIALSVADTGPGIPPTTLERIFEPFFTTKPPGEGTGLGLAISHGIARSHGGSISAENQPGGGARFTLRLPLDHTQWAAGEKPQTAGAAPPSDGVATEKAHSE
ncbi:MAG: GAF domain-containing protein [Chloroflexales bacterium]|nr:GAF domain-containing protein [Chloroflexales bacterium]